ncbi:hypothetical protein K443DRAFT_135676 [Laccaria amethystina LaAM-08-1]|uniref:F-box domain-containing protein n=1 Tax=Laccaria amethystina LaAM-08-1 TaxID=1095629 RepID=A0A0C9WLK4_9AGAR|nr:hypothetical protein K443DRAFT_135676 [Laccaria amethystina LaAM-08-1]
MSGLLDRLPVEIVLAILEHVPKNSLLGLSLTCCLLNYLSTLVLLEHCGIRDPTNCTFDLYATEGQADALSALQAGLHIQWMKFLRCNLWPPGYYPQWDWPPAKLIHRLHCLMLRLISFDEVVLSFNMWGMIAPHDTYLISGVIILQNLLNTVITKPSFFGQSYLFNPLDSGSSITQGLWRFIHHNDSPDWQYRRNINKGNRPFLACSPAALQQMALSRMEIDALSLFIPPCSSWTFTMLKQSRITSLMVNLMWSTSTYAQAECSLIFSQLAEALQASLKSFLVESSTITSFPLVLTMETISAPADLIFYMFSRSLIVPRLKTIFLTFQIKKYGGLFDITTTATSIAQLRESVRPNVKLLVLFHFDRVPPLEGSKGEFSRFTTLSLNGLTALLDSPNTFQVILGVLTLFSKLKELHIQLKTSYQAIPTPINLKTWMVEAILDQSPNVTSISCNGTAQRMTPCQSTMPPTPINLTTWMVKVALVRSLNITFIFPTEVLHPDFVLSPALTFGVQGVSLALNSK